MAATAAALFTPAAPAASVAPVKVSVTVSGCLGVSEDGRPYSHNRVLSAHDPGDGALVFVVLDD